MYFVKREDEYIDTSGLSFRDLLKGKLPGHGNLRATQSDWANHVSTIFPEVRLKRYLEMRGADSGPWARLTALPAFWVGLLYDETSLDAAWDLAKGWSVDERQKLRDDVPTQALNATIRGRKVRELAKECLALAETGLKRRGFLDSDRRDESRYLEPLHEIVARGTTPAEELLEKYNGAWGKSVDPVFEEYAY
jgi:glutamate--cysteine ligase